VNTSRHARRGRHLRRCVGSSLRGAPHPSLLGRRYWSQRARTASSQDVTNARTWLSRGEAQKRAVHCTHLLRTSAGRLACGQASARFCLVTRPPVPRRRRMPSWARSSASRTRFSWSPPRFGWRSTPRSTTGMNGTTRGIRAGTALRNRRRRGSWLARCYGRCSFLDTSGIAGLLRRSRTYRERESELRGPYDPARFGRRFVRALPAP
jgi:hypothetical protein